MLKHDNIRCNDAGPGGHSPLLIAAESGDVELVKELLGKDGIECNKASPGGPTPLFVAVQNGHIKVVEALLQSPGIDICKTFNNESPLAVAVRQRDAGITALLCHAASLDTLAGEIWPIPFSGTRVDIRTIAHANDAEYAIAMWKGSTLTHKDPSSQYRMPNKHLVRLRNDLEAYLTGSKIDYRQFNTRYENFFYPKIAIEETGKVRTGAATLLLALRRRSLDIAEGPGASGI